MLERLNFFIQPVGIALIINGIMSNEFSQFVKFLEYSFFAWIGGLSYSIYLWQGLFLKKGPGSSFWIQQFPQNLFLTFSCAMLSFYFIEKKFMAIKNKYRVISINHN